MASQRGWLDALLDRLAGWRAGLPPEQNSYTREPVTIALGEDADGVDDGVALAADVYRPVAAAAAAAGTLLVQTPYGRAAPMSLFLARTWAARGYNVLLVSTRGTFGSGAYDRFDPARTDQADGIRVVRWMRRQPWYTGSFATFGMSYLGYAQWALMDTDDPLDDHAAAVVEVAPHDFASLVWGTGALWLAILDWAAMTAAQQSRGALALAYWMLTAGPDGHAAAKRAVPLAAGARALLGGADAPAYRWLLKWLTSSRADQRADPRGHWAPTRHGRALDAAARRRAPVLLVGGWQDVFVRDTLEQYARLRAGGGGGGGPVALTVGPWHHGQVAGARGVAREAWDWVEAHASRRAAGDARRAPVRVDFSGAGGTRWLPSWPPATTPLELYLDCPSPSSSSSSSPSGGQLARDRPPRTDQARFTFDPHDPTPTLGGPLLVGGGYVDDAALARRADVLSFTSAPLDRDVACAGEPRVELLHGSDNPHVDVFVRLSEVDVAGAAGPRGASRNVCEAYRRLDPAGAGGTAPRRVALGLTPCAHTFRRGRAVRLVVAGGNFPHYSYNLGSGENQGTGTTLRPATHTVHTGGDGGSRLILPVM